MADRVKFANVRQKIIEALRDDLMGPNEGEEILDENPKYAYLVGVLAPKADGQVSVENEQEVDEDIAYEDGSDFTAGEEDDNEPISVSSFDMPSSIGISFYVETSLPSINLEVRWGDYTCSTEKQRNQEGKETKVVSYKREQMEETLTVNFADFKHSKEYRLICDPKVCVHVSRIQLKKGYSLVTAYVINQRFNEGSDFDAMMFQVEIIAKSLDGSNVFIAEHICRDVLAPDEYYFEQRPIFGRGRGCAATWEETADCRTSEVKSSFIPQHEFPGVSAALDGFDPFYFSMRDLSVKTRKNEIIDKLKVLADTYDAWIQNTLANDAKMNNPEFVQKVGKSAVDKCAEALRRIREGIDLISNDDISFDAFCFMNRCMILQRNISNYAKKHGAGVECNFKEFVDPKNRNNSFGWRPFQIAFILMNLSAIVDPLHQDREIVDLLYFPTGGGKTEAYLGLMAFAIANRRLRANESDEYNRDGGVTAILRYTLRLLTTQQRDRITKMVLAAEMLRQKELPKYGKEPISIGFWVGGGVTPNDFDSLKEDPANPEKTEKARAQKRLIYKQLLTCPFCGKSLLKDDNDLDITDRTFTIDIPQKSVEIYCLDKDCTCYKYREDRIKIPVYLVDEEIYAKCPTIILSTVDKFARLPWDEKTNSIFGRVDRCCSRDGYVAIGGEHSKHNKTEGLPASTLTPIRPFLPPELIIQDELHLITGPLGTVYGAYETIIEDMCTYTNNGRKILPKYIVSTATIKNAAEQAKCLYGRRNTAQFPPSGFEIGDSFFIKEIPTKEYPFREYVGVCAPGKSVKNALLRIYAVVLQKAYDLSLQEEYKDAIDPYYTLVGYYNSIRELGGAVRLLQDDIPKRIRRLKNKYNMQKERYLNRRTNAEITSRMSSYKIPEQLKKLETTFEDKDCLDTAIATNMIAVGMDVDRLGLMVVTGQPKQNSEYIQATSRIGRAFPGLVITLYNPYRPRDLSHYENFTGYHSQLYRFVEGTTATPFSARARDRVLHALIISAVRLKYPQFAVNAGAGAINSLTAEQLTEIKSLILNRLNIIKPSAREDAEEEIEQFIDKWKTLAAQEKQLLYYIFNTKKNNRLMNYYGESCTDMEKATLSSMREVENAANMYYYTEG